VGFTSFHKCHRSQTKSMGLLDQVVYREWGEEVKLVNLVLPDKREWEGLRRLRSKCS